MEVLLVGAGVVGTVYGTQLTNKSGSAWARNTLSTGASKSRVIRTIGTSGSTSTVAFFGGGHFRGLFLGRSAGFLVGLSGRFEMDGSALRFPGTADEPGPFENL